EERAREQETLASSHALVSKVCDGCVPFGHVGEHLARGQDEYGARGDSSARADHQAVAGEIDRDSHIDHPHPTTITALQPTLPGFLDSSERGVRHPPKGEGKRDPPTTATRDGTGHALHGDDRDDDAGGRM